MIAAIRRGHLHHFSRRCPPNATRSVSLFFTHSLQLRRNQMFPLRLKRHTRRLVVVLLIGLLGCLCLWGLPTSAKIPAPLRSAAQGQEAKQDQLSPSTLTTTMYGGNGGHNNSDSINDGSLVII